MKMHLRAAHLGWEETISSTEKDQKFMSLTTVINNELEALNIPLPDTISSSSAQKHPASSPAGSPCNRQEKKCQHTSEYRSLDIQPFNLPTVPM
jgi:hypothetical protein